MTHLRGNTGLAEVRLPQLNPHCQGNELNQGLDSNL